MLLKELLEGKEPALHLMPTAGIKVQKFDGKKHDFAAAVTAQYGRPIIKKEGDKTYYVKQGRVVAKYDSTLDKGFVYSSNKVNGSANQFFASDASNEEDYVMVLVRNANEESEDYHGVNVLLYPDGKVDASTADSIADKEWKEHKAEITKIAKAKAGVKESTDGENAYNRGHQDGWDGKSYENPYSRTNQPEEWDDYKSGYQLGQTEADDYFAVNEGFADTVGVMIDQTVGFFEKIGNYITGADAKRLKKFLDSDVPKIEDMLAQAKKMAPYFKAAQRSKILSQIRAMEVAVAKEDITTKQMDSIISGCEYLGSLLKRYMNPKENAKLKNPKVAEATLYELSRQTVGAYRKKAQADLDKTTAKHDEDNKDGWHYQDSHEEMAAWVKMDKRKRGLARANGETAKASVKEAATTLANAKEQLAKIVALHKAEQKKAKPDGRELARLQDGLQYWQDKIDQLEG